MNRKQIQLNICKELLNPSSRCAGVFINEDEFAITTNGFTGYIFPKNECVFDISKIRISKQLKPHFVELETDVEIKKTNYLYKTRQNKVIEKYVGKDFEVYVDTKLAKPFEGYRFFCSSSKGRILVKDNFDRSLGIFLPVRFDESEVTTNA